MVLAVWLGFGVVVPCWGQGAPAVKAVVPAAPVAPIQGGLVDRLNAARAAFDAGKFAEAAAGFAGVEQDFGQNPQATKAIAAHRALHAMALARAGDAAAALPAIDAAMVLAETTPVAREGLAYLKGLMLFQLQRWGDARADLLAYFDKPVHPRQRRLEALLLAGTCYQKEGDLAGAAKFFKDAAGKIRKAEPVAAARAELVSLQWLVQAGDLDGALAAIVGRDAP